MSGLGWLVTCLLFRSQFANASIDWSLPDQLVGSTVTALLHVAALYPNYRTAATAAILEFTGRTVEQLKSESREFRTALVRS